MKEVNIVFSLCLRALPLIVEHVLVAGLPAGVDVAVDGRSFVLFEFLSCIFPLRIAWENVAVLLPVLAESAFAGGEPLIPRTHALRIGLTLLSSLQ